MPTTFEDIHHAADLLRKGGVVAFPTETVYGLGADALNPAAIDRVYELKGRPRHNPLIVHVSGPEMARRVAREWSDRADLLARRFWPGPLSLLVPRAPSLPEIVTAGSELVAVRCPNHPVTLALLFEYGHPLVGPSANLSGQVSPTTAAHVRESFSADDVFVLEGGACEAGIESTVLDITSPTPRILRPGLIGAKEIAAVLGCEVLGPASPSDRGERPIGEPLHSPGLLERHYAPRTPAHLFDEQDWPRVLERGRPAVVITHRLRDVDPPHQIIEMPPDPADYAALLYAALREADRRAVAVILIERPPTPPAAPTPSDSARDADGPIWAAIADRLSRATTPLAEDD